MMILSQSALTGNCFSMVRAPPLLEMLLFTPYGRSAVTASRPLEIAFGDGAGCLTTVSFMGRCSQQVHSTPRTVTKLYTDIGKKTPVLGKTEVVVL